jgi:GxxExxY protein
LDCLDLAHVQGSSGCEELTDRIIGCAIAVHRFFGAGLLESVYEKSLIIELKANGLKVNRECTIPLVYRGHSLGTFRPDCIVEDTVLVEVKAVLELAPIHNAQVITYLKLTRCPVGLLINFNSPLVTAGVRRLKHPDLYVKNRG